MKLVCGKCNGTQFYVTTEQAVRGMGWMARGQAVKVKKCKKCDVNMIVEQVKKTPKEIAKKWVISLVGIFAGLIVLMFIFVWLADAGLF